jgi:bisphosphoglycerate-independent phosphoglycerate mutase (AlkP superfamily)
MVAAKAKFAQIPRPGSADWIFVPLPSAADKTKEASQPMEKQANRKNLAGDDAVTENALQILRKHKPDLMFVHFGSPDVTGHGKGWGSPEQIAAIEHVDGYIGKIVDVYESLSLLGHTAVIINADHGGACTSHGADDVRSRTIPWIIAGPGIRKNFDLTREPELEVNIYDTFATSCYLLGIPLPGKTDAKPILQAIEANSQK